MNKKLYLIKQIIFLILGTFIMSVAINALLIPHQILSGGITGLAVFLQLAFGINASIAILIFNIPLLILGYIFINKRFVKLSILGMALFSFFLSVTENFTIETNEILTAILLGSVLNGLGSGLILRVNASAGGSDIIGKIVNKYFSFSIGSVIFTLDVIVITLSVSFFGIDLAVYTLANMFIATKVIKYVIEGLNYKRTVFIITNNEQLISNKIMSELRRGVTIIHGTGAYTKERRDILYCIIGIRQVARLKMLVQNIDPKAFISVTETSSVYGHGRGFLKMIDED